MGDVAAVELIVVVAVVVIVAVPSAVIAAAVIRAARLPHPAALVAALGVLTGVALAGYVATEAESLATLAGTGLGALAGAVTAVYRDDDRDPPPPPSWPPPDGP